MADSITVLHVEDDPDFAALTADVLEREDDRFDVVHVQSVGEGLDRLEDDAVDCVVSDYEMPEQNGIEFLERVRDRDPDLPFILYTGKGSEEVASEAIFAGVTDYLQKETGVDQFAILANRVANAVEGHRSRQILDDRNQELHIFERIFNTMQGGACLYDREGRFQIVNDYLVDFYDTTREELEGHPSGLIARIREESESDPYQDLIDGERSVLQGEIEMEGPARGTVITEYRLTPLTIDDTVEGVVGVARDVTGRVEHERELQRAHEEYEELINGMNDTALVTDLDGNFRAVNDAAVETIGYSREELLSMRAHDIDAGLEDERITELIERMPEVETQVFETVHETTDGEQIPVEISSSLITHRGETAILSVGRDISDRKEREKRLEEFASVVSHDLRNPLNVAKSRLELAREECASDHLADVARAHDRMGELIEDLLTLAREGDQLRDPAPVDLQALVDDCWGTVETREATLETDLDRTILADRSRLQQLIENLVRNAVEHGDETGMVTVGELADGFYVEDDGQGIPPDVRDGLFDRTHSGNERIGLGLSIVELVAEGHGWSITATEGGDGGARFEITGVEFVQGE